MALAATVALLPAQTEGPDERSFRYRIQTADSLFQRVKSAWAQQKIAYSAYRSMIEILRDEELEISQEAKVHQFKDPAESNYWSRGRLKFPSPIQTELRLLDEGRDPASVRQ